MKEQPLRFKNATIDDVDDIVTINNSFLEYNPSTGFIISKLNNQWLKNYILQHPDLIGVAITSDDIIVGFIELSLSVDESVLKKIKWLNNRFRRGFENVEKLYIEKVAVKQEYQQKNVAKFLYETVFSKYPEYIFYSFVVKKPYLNNVSMNFHKKMGFVEAAKFETENFLGLENYESMMFIKFR